MRDRSDDPSLHERNYISLLQENKERKKEGRMEGWKDGSKEGNVLFKDALSVFYVTISLYGVGERKKEN